MGRVVVVGAANMDLVVRVAALPRAGETVLGGDLARAAGGKGANQAVAARRAGATVSLVGAVGADDLGDATHARLAAEGIDVTHLRRVADAPSGVALIAVAANGENSIVVAPGANARLSPADVTAAASTLLAAQVVVAQLEVPLAAVTTAFALAHPAGARTLLNPAPAQALPANLLAQTSILVCNEVEAELLTGRAVADVAAAERAAADLAARGPTLVIITLGARGAVAWEATGVVVAPAFAVPVVDTTAAGDAFIGALAAWLAEGAPTPRALRLATAAAALCVGRAGAQPSLPDRAAILARAGERSPPT